MFIKGKTHTSSSEMVDMVVIILIKRECSFPSALKTRLLSYDEGAGTNSFTHINTFMHATSRKHLLNIIYAY